MSTYGAWMWAGTWDTDDLVRGQHRPMHRGVVTIHQDDTYKRMYVEQLMPDYMIVLPIPYGLSRVMDRPHFDSPAEREYISITVLTENGIKKLICTRHMPFDVITNSV